MQPVGLGCSHGQAQTWRHFLQAVYKLLHHCLVLGVEHNGPVAARWSSKSIPLPKASCPVGILQLVSCFAALCTQDGLRLQHPCPELMKILGKLEVPASHVISNLLLILQPVSKLDQGLGALLRVLPGVLPHALHQVEIGALLIRKAGHVAKLWDEENWTTGAASLLSQLWHRDQQGLLHICDLLVVASLIVLHVAHLLLVLSLKLISGLLVPGDLVD